MCWLCSVQKHVTGKFKHRRALHFLPRRATCPSLMCWYGFLIKAAVAVWALARCLIHSGSGQLKCSGRIMDRGRRCGRTSLSLSFCSVSQGDSCRKCENIDQGVNEMRRVKRIFQLFMARGVFRSSSWLINENDMAGSNVTPINTHSHTRTGAFSPSESHRGRSVYLHDVSEPVTISVSQNKYLTFTAQSSVLKFPYCSYKKRTAYPSHAMNLC